MMIPRRSVPLILILALGGAQIGWGQLDLRLETPKSSYLQHAPIPVTISLKNLGGQPLLLAEDAGQPWLELIVQSNDGLLMKAERPLVPPEVRLQPGEARNLPLDLAQYYLVRTRGVSGAGLGSGSLRTNAVDRASFLFSGPGRGDLERSPGRGKRTKNLFPAEILRGSQRRALFEGGGSRAQSGLSRPPVGCVSPDRETGG